MGGVSKDLETVLKPSATILDAMSEAEFQRLVVAGLKQRGYLVWHVVDARLMAAGLPDVIAAHPTRVPRRLLMWELKRAKGGRVSPEQKAALAALSDVFGVDARVLRPADWLLAKELL